MSDTRIPKPKFQAGPVEFIGRVPIRTELTVLPSEVPFERRFKIYDGYEVHRVLDDGGVAKEPLRRKRDLKRGLPIALADGMGWGTIEKSLLRGWYLQLGPRRTGTLTFSKDDRKCWVCTGILVDARQPEKG